MVGLRDLARAYKDVRFFGISRDTPDESRALAKKIAADGKGPLGFPLLFDAGSRVIDRYGIRDPSYAKEKLDGVPKPSVFILDRDGKIRWQKVEEDYRERPSNEDVASALDAFD